MCVHTEHRLQARVERGWDVLSGVSWSILRGRAREGRVAYSHGELALRQRNGQL